MPNSDFTTGPPITGITTKIIFFEIFRFFRNHLGTTQEHPGGVLDDLGAVFGLLGPV